ncbi:MAG TPA: 50S ribosomal protein L19e [Candidatus Nanoarchaeia archaeon]|nr:50S ribosomal protein L19e [Candidatus Nanoarchaeia archaeon]
MRHKKNLAGKILGVSPKKVRFADDALEDIQKAITRSDMRGLIAVGKISTVNANQHSRAGARKVAAQKRKGRRRGKGSRKGTKHSLVTRKEKWTSRVRAQRNLLKELRDKQLLSTQNYQMLYRKSKGGYFRNRRHIKLYLKEHHLIEAKQ